MTYSAMLKKWAAAPARHKQMPQHMHMEYALLFVKDDPAGIENAAQEQ